MAINQSSRPYTLHRKRRLGESILTTGWKPALRQSVTQENSQKQNTKHELLQQHLTTMLAFTILYNNTLIIYGHAATQKLVILWKLVASKPLRQIQENSPPVDFVHLPELKPACLRLVFLYALPLEPCHPLFTTVTEASPEKALSICQLAWKLHLAAEGHSWDPWKQNLTVALSGWI